jgi:lipopolysaccharide transport system ATP-binding protein
VTVPGNLLTEGTLTVGSSIIKESPFVIHAEEEATIVFQVLDSVEGNSARGDYGGRMKGIIRPLLDWNTEFEPAPDSDMQLERAFSEGGL